jgi:hypothetical protein
MSGNTGVAGGTKGADPVPTKAPDGSTVLDESSAQVVNTEKRREYPHTPTGEQNRDYPNGNERGVDDRVAREAKG